MFDMRNSHPKCKYQDLLFGEKLCTDIFYEDQLKYYIDSNFYTDNNGDGVIHIPVLFGEDESYQHA
jgi:hypothetical protein